ncbi:MAG: DUF2190 family protein [Zoogloeaceae bacterium]|jgi:hypothetical protein|nr:DUF2190 family protein [Zoogloeaceae bacterium]
MPRQYEKTHATTVIATVPILAHSFVSYGGAYASGAAGAGGLTDCVGISETGAAVGETVSVVTAHSFPAVAGAAISAGQYVKPGTGGVAVVGAIDDHCGIALEAADVGDLFELRLLPHVHPAS